MLAYMPHSPSLPDVRDHPPSLATGTSKMSLAILPSSPMTYGQPANLSGPPSPSPSKRPKLSLDTSTLPSAFGKRSTSLRLDTLSATSPTIRNTFSNAYHPEQQVRTPGGKPKRPILTPLAISTLPPPVEQKPQESAFNTPVQQSAGTHSSSTTPSTTSASTLDSAPVELPYKPSYSIPSILANGPLPRTTSQRKMTSQARPMFPLAKKVSFRAPLTEEIKTEKYTLRHSDIESSTSTISTLELPPPKYGKDGEIETEQTDVDESPIQNSQSDERGRTVENVTISQPVTGGKRESSDEDEDDEDSEAGANTPVAGRRKRHRQWVWTLGPIESDIAGAKSASSMQADHRSDSPQLT